MRKSRGRQKLAMVKIQSESNRLVTFSKRRSGIFKKASELSTLCGIDVTVVVFSPGQRVFSFGHPSVEQVINRFYSGRQYTNPPPMSATTQFIESQRKVRLQEIGFQLNQVLEHLDVGKKRGVELDRIIRSNRNKTLVDTPMENLDITQLLQLKASLELLKARVENQAHIKAHAHALAQAHVAQAQAQAEHYRQQQVQHQLYNMNPTVVLPTAPEPHLQLAAESNNNMNNGGDASPSHLEFYQKLMNISNMSIGGDDDGGNGSMMVNNGAYHH